MQYILKNPPPRFAERVYTMPRIRGLGDAVDLPADYFTQTRKIVGPTVRAHRYPKLNC